MIWSAGLGLLFMNGACHNGQKDSHATVQTEFLRLQDSVKVFAPGTPALADSLMRTAPDSLAYYGFLIQKAKWLLSADRTDSVKTYAMRTLDFARRQTPSPYTHTLQSLSYAIEAARLHATRQDIPQSIILNRQAYEHALLSENKEFAPDFAANLADCYIFQNDIPSAAQWYRRALFLADSLHLSTERTVTLYLGLGQIYTSLADFKSAQKYYELADRKFDQMPANMQAYFLNNYGNYFYFKKDYPQALRTFLRLRNHLQQTFGNENRNLYICKVNLADTYLNLDEITLAEKYAAEALGYFCKTHLETGIYYAHTIQIGIALKKKQYHAVEQILSQEHDIHCEDLNIRGIRNRYLTEYYAHTGDYRRAFLTETANRQEQDLAEHNKQNMRTSEIMARFTEDTLRLHYELELSNRDVVMSRSRATLWGLVSALVVLVSAFVTLMFYFRKRRVQTNLDMFVLRLAAIRQRISPHFVFNVINAKIGKSTQSESDVLVNMAKLIRQNLELSGRTYVSLTEELNFVNRYMELQRTLLEGDLDFVRELPSAEQLNSIMIPSMFVQILVENAVKHGLKAVCGVKRLVISVECDDTATTIRVTDNGPGFDIRRSQPNSTKTGLYVIRHTMSVMNKNNKPEGRMKFHVHNMETADGHIEGCVSTLIIPRKMKMI